MADERQPETTTHYWLCKQFLIADIASGMKVLDVGCGEGKLMCMLSERGCTVTGIDLNAEHLETCRLSGLQVQAAKAEALPFPAESLDAIVCSVVLPYTEQRQAVSEWARTLKPGGAANITCHGVGYGLAYAVFGPGLDRRIYGTRMLVNTLYYRLVGRRLPGFLGDTLCQTSRRLSRYYREFGLTLEREQVVGTVLGRPKFLCHRVLKPQKEVE